MKISLNWIKAFVDIPKDLTAEKLGDLLTLHTAEVEDVDQQATAYQKDDAVLDIDNKSLTHRPDLWGHYGIAREFAAITKQPLKPIEDTLNVKGEDQAKGQFAITLEDIAACPRFSACVMTNIKIVESPQWIKSRLQAAGVRPINNVVDATNYVMLELGQPMHAYDRDFLGSDELVVRFAKDGEVLETIDHKKRELLSSDLLICNGKNQPVGLGGIMGGANSEITDDTTEITLEAASFDPIMIRKSSTHHTLRSDASQRFEKGLDPALTELAIRRAITLIQETCPDATLVTPVITEGPWKPETPTITLDPAITRNLIGVDIDDDTIQQLLESLEFKVAKKGNHFEVTVPTHRATGDVAIAEDLIEEVARLHGYDAVPAIIPQLPIDLPRENVERFHKHDTRRILADQLGFTEVNNYSFYSKPEFKACGLEDMHHLRVLNALSTDHTHMRTSLVPNLLKNVQSNGAERDHMEIFEIGRTYKEQGEFMPLEEKWLAGLVASKDDNEVFYAVKGALETYLERFHAPKYILRDCHTPPAYAHPKKCVELMVKGDVIGLCFELHPAVAQAHGIDHNVGLFELNFTKLVALGRGIAEFTELPKYPSMPFDISLLIDKKTAIGDVQNTIQRADKSGLIRKVELFDIYEGKGIPDDKKSLAFNIELRHDDHTLTEDEFRTVQDAVIKAVEKMGGEVRGG